MKVYGQFVGIASVPTWDLVRRTGNNLGKEWLVVAMAALRPVNLRCEPEIGVAALVPPVLILTLPLAGGVGTPVESDGRKFDGHCPGAEVLRPTSLYAQNQN